MVNLGYLREVINTSIIYGDHDKQIRGLNARLEFTSMKYLPPMENRSSPGCEFTHRGFDSHSLRLAHSLNHDPPPRMPGYPELRSWLLRRPPFTPGFLLEHEPAPVSASNAGTIGAYHTPAGGKHVQPGHRGCHLRVEPDCGC